MKNKEIQERRMRGYFIDATKEILKGEGIRSVNVRNIADKAGYSYATLYNYFKDVKDLIFYCVEDFYKEMEEYAETQSKNLPDGLEKLKSKLISYVHYFVEYPGIFELFFLERLGDLGQKRETLDVITSGMDRLCDADWQYCIENNRFSEKQAEFAKKTLRVALPGMLLIYLNRLTPQDYNHFNEQVKEFLDNVLNTLEEN